MKTILIAIDYVLGCVCVLCGSIDSRVTLYLLWETRINNSHKYHLPAWFPCHHTHPGNEATLTADYFNATGRIGDPTPNLIGHCTDLAAHRHNKQKRSQAAQNELQIY